MNSSHISSNRLKNQSGSQTLVQLSSFPPGELPLQEQGSSWLLTILTFWEQKSKLTDWHWIWGHKAEVPIRWKLCQIFFHLILILLNLQTVPSIIWCLSTVVVMNYIEFIYISFTFVNEIVLIVHSHCNLI